MGEIRPAEASDLDRICEIHVSSWQAAYQDILPPEFLARLSAGGRRREWWTNVIGDGQTFVVDADGQVAGFVRVAATDDPDLGEVQAIYLDPRFYRKGLGGPLLERAESHLCSMGYKHAVLWVFVDNQGARRFYEAMGWEAESRTALMELGGQQMTEIRYRKALA